MSFDLHPSAFRHLFMTCMGCWRFAKMPNCFRKLLRQLCHLKANTAHLLVCRSNISHRRKQQWSNCTRLLQYLARGKSNGLRACLISFNGVSSGASCKYTGLSAKSWCKTSSVDQAQIVCHLFTGDASFDIVYIKMPLYRYIFCSSLTSTPFIQNTSDATGINYVCLFGQRCTL